MLPNQRSLWVKAKCLLSLLIVDHHFIHQMFDNEAISSDT